MIPRTTHPNYLREGETLMDTTEKNFSSLSDTGPGETYRESVDRSRACKEAMWEGRHDLNPRDAVNLAQRLLVAVLEDGVDYGDFQSAQAVEKYVRRARNALRGLSLS